MDNPKAFKHRINFATAERLADNLKAAYDKFDSKGFINDIQSGLSCLELKQRVDFVTKAMAKRLPSDYRTALKIVLKTLGPELKTETDVSQDLFYHWIHAHFVEVFGLNHFDESLGAMVEITKRSTSEFAIRPFLIKDHKRVLGFLKKQISNPNLHVRRWISEGTRPLLPWGMRIPQFVKDPYLTLDLIDGLKNDPSAYVRNSVANHINDIAKHHPEVATRVAQHWLKQNFEHSQWMARRALRHLIKAGYSDAFKALGFSTNFSVSVRRFMVRPTRLMVGQCLFFSLLLQCRSNTRVVVDFAIGYKLARGRIGRKVYKLTELDLEPGKPISLKKTFPIRPITTRTYYTGSHVLEILVNGRIAGKKTFELISPHA